MAEPRTFADKISTLGPVRSVKPELVFEIGFEGIARSSRHKSGVALRFPRILRWRHDKTPKQADTLETLQRFLKPEPTEEPLPPNDPKESPLSHPHN